MANSPRSRLRPRRTYQHKKNYFRDLLLRDWFGGGKSPSVSEGMATSSDIVESIVSDLNLDQGIALETLNDCWSEVAGDFIASNSSPLGIENGTLTISVNQPMIKHQLLQMQSGLLKKLQKELPKLKIKSLYFTIR